MFADNRAHGKKMSVVRLWPAEKAYYFFFRVFRANEREREASEEHRQTRHTREGRMHLPPSRVSGALARFALALAGK